MREAVPEPIDKPPASMSLFRYSPGLILVCIAIADSIRRPDPDLWGHVPFGQAVLRLHHLVLRDPYSYSAPGHNWNNHEWLTEVLMAAIFNHAGVFGLVILKLACSTVVILALAAALAETGSSTLVQFAVLIGSAVVIKPQLQFRPQSFTFALTAVLICILTQDAYRRTAACGSRFRSSRYGRTCTAVSSWASQRLALTLPCRDCRTSWRAEVTIER